MGSPKRLFGLVFFFLLFVSTGTLPAKEKTNLLTLPNTTLKTTSAPEQEQPRLKELRDGKFEEVVISTQGSLEVVYEFGGTTVTPQELVVYLPKKIQEKALPVRVEILVSLLSPHAGFQSLRTDPLKAASYPQSFKFNPQAARWIMVRFTPGEGAGSISLAEVSVLGHQGAPVSLYSFKESPAKAFEILKMLKGVTSLKLTLSKEEADLFQDALDGKLHRWSFARAALMASGVKDPLEQKRYEAIIERLITEAKKLFGNLKNPFEKGEKLLRWLHKKSTLKKYLAGQTDLSVVLDKGLFNCVSSATLYNIIGRRLGLDLRAIEVPSHIFSILYDGTRHADVETTTRSGFNPARDKKAQEAFKKKTGFRYIPDKHRDKRREVGEVGLVALIYYNHGVFFSRQGRYHEGLYSYFRALSLDPEFTSAGKNALSLLINWSVKLSREEKFEPATHILTVGLKLASRDATFIHNSKVIWRKYAQALIEQGKDKEAQSVLNKASEILPAEKGYFTSLKAWLYIRKGEQLAKKGQWERALGAASKRAFVLEEGPAKELNRWRMGLYLRWASSELRKKNFEEALAILEKGFITAPQNRKIRNNLAYTIQEWGKSLLNRRASEKERFFSAIKGLEKIPEVRKVARYHVRRMVYWLQKSGQHREALKSLEKYKDLLESPEEIKKITLSLLNGLSLRLVNQSKFKEALEVIEKGLALDPQYKNLVNNLAYTVQEYAKKIYSVEGYEKSLALLPPLMKRFEKFPGVKRVARHHLLRVLQELQKKGKYQEALEALEGSGDLLDSRTQDRVRARAVYLWANDKAKKDDWQGGVDLYGKILKKYPKNRDLERSAINLWNSWGMKCNKEKNWDQAIQIYQQGLTHFPQSRILKNNLSYSRWKKSKEGK